MKSDTRKLTKTVVDNAKPGEARYCMWDSETKGFGLRIQPTGAKSYVFLYRTPEGAKRWYTIGTHGNVTVDQARAKAKELAGKIATGADADPAKEKKARRNALTVAELLDTYIQSAKFAEKTESTKSTDYSRIHRHIKPLIGGEIADKLTKEQVRKMFADIRDGETAADEKTHKKRGRSIVKGGEGTARKATRILRAALNWGIEQGYLKDNPATEVNIGKDKVRRAIIEGRDEYRIVFAAIDKMESERKLRSPVADAIRLVILTGARRGEIAKLKWSQVDMRKGLLILSPESHKTGSKTGEDREIGLSTAAQAIIVRQPVESPESLVFPSTKRGVPNDLSKAWTKIRAEAGLPKDVVLHTMRHSLATSLAFQGAQAAEIMAAMGHRHISTSQKYIHWTQDAKAALAERYTSGIAAAMTEPQSASVIPLTPKQESK